jgi:hypothetical protein
LRRVSAFAELEGVETFAKSKTLRESQPALRHVKERSLEAWVGNRFSFLPGLGCTHLAVSNLLAE